MVIGRVIGWLLLFLAATAAITDLWGWYDTGNYSAAQIGALWQRIDPETLYAIRPPLEHLGSGWLWDPLMVDFLNLPAALSLAVLSFAFIWLFRRREKRRRR